MDSDLQRTDSSLQRTDSEHQRAVSERYPYGRDLGLRDRRHEHGDN
jgi:hypothetical protein